LRLNEAIKLLGVLSDFQFEPSKEKPKFTICDNGIQGYTLCAKAKLITEAYHDYLEEIVGPHKLGIHKSQGYLIIQGCFL